MSRKNFSHEMKDGEQAVEVDGVQYMKQLNRELKGAERRKCDEKYDIRDTGIKGNPFCPSGRKVVDRIIRSSEKPSVGRDPDLHSDTTEPGENTVTAMKKGGITSSAQEQFRIQKDKKVPDATKMKVFNS